MFPYVNKTKTNLLNIILSRYTFCNSCYYTVDVMACVRALISIKKKIIAIILWCLFLSLSPHVFSIGI